jgi:hypothetical protein
MSILGGLGFGSGVIYAAPQSGSGNPAINPTPQSPGVIQNVKFDLDAEIKGLFGTGEWAVDSAIGKRTIKGSFEFAQWTNALVNQLFLGSDSTLSTGSVLSALWPGEAHTVPAVSGPYTVTVTNATDTPLIDYGVTYAATGIALEKVASLTGAGQYMVNLSTGVYTFDSADASAAVLINYSWTLAGGTTLVVGQTPMGNGPVLAMNVVMPYEQNQGGAQSIIFNFPNVRLGKISAATKIDDYTMYTVDWQAFAGAAGNPFNCYAAN